MLYTGQTYFKNLAVSKNRKILKYVGPFYNIMHETVKVQIKDNFNLEPNSFSSFNEKSLSVLWY